MKLALLQAQARVLDCAHNLTVIDDAAARAAQAGAAVLLTPELFPCGYDPLRVRRELDPAALPSVRDELRRIARRHAIALVYSLPVVAEDGTWRIGATLLDRNGEVRLDYAKVHLFGAEERQAFTGAIEPPQVIRWEGFETSLLICYDVEFPEAVRAAADRGAQLVLVPTALAAGFSSVPDVLVRARALESQVAIAYANHCGTEGGLEFCGTSLIAGAVGEVLARAGEGPEILYADVTPEGILEARKAVPYLQERSPELYRSWAEGN